MFLGVSLQITNAFANDYLTNYFGGIEEYNGTFGVEHANILISLSQLSETLCILLIPFFLKRYGIKNVMLISMLAWVLRFALLGLGDPGTGVWMLILSMIVYGVAFDFFNVSGAMFVQQEAPKSMQGSAQGLFMLMTNGIGASVGTYIAGKIVDHFCTWEGGHLVSRPEFANGWQTTWFIFAGYALVVALMFMILFRYKHDRSKVAEVKH